MLLALVGVKKIKMKLKLKLKKVELANLFKKPVLKVGVQVLSPTWPAFL